MSHNRSVKLIVSLLLVVVLLMGCAAPAAQAPEPDAAPAPAADAAPAAEPAEAAKPAGPAMKVTMAFTSAQPYLGHTAYFVARELGYWEDANLDVEFEWTSGSGQAIQLLGAGQVDFTAANHDTLIFALDKGAKMKAVFQEHTKCEFDFAVPKDSPITKVEDMVGKRIGVSSLSSGFVSFAKAAFFEAGLDYNAINFVEVGSGATAATAISSGEIDVLGLWEVAFATLENTLGVDYFRYIKPPLYDRVACNAVITSDDMINNHPDEVAGFLRGLAMGTLFMETNPEAAIEIFYKNVPEAKPLDKDDATIMKEALHVTECENQQRSNENRPKENPMHLWGYVVASELLEAQDVNILMGTLTNKLTADDMMTNQFIAGINDFDSAAVIEQAKNYTVS